MVRKKHIQELERLLEGIEQKVGSDIVERIRKEYEAVASTDGLTGSYDNPTFKKRLGKEIKKAEKEKYPISVIILDADSFWIFNEAHGHLEGDSAIIKIKEAIEKQVRKDEDLVARYGGEEFAIMIPKTDKKKVKTIAERIREYVKVTCPDPKKLTVSIGISHYPEHGETVKELIEKADKSLYRAKHNGRDRVHVYPK